MPKRSSKECKIKDCTNPVHAKGFCGRHYMQWRTGVIRFDGTQKRSLYNVKYTHCIVCNRPIASGGSKNLGFCSTHYTQYRNGKIDKRGLLKVK